MGLRATFFWITLLLAAVLAGCRGLTPSSSASSSPPSPAGSTPAASSVTQYLYTADSGSRTITAYKINADGALTSVPGSPFAAGGANIPGTPRFVRAVGSTLIVGDPPLWTFTVDAASGAIQKSDESTPGPVDVAVDPSSAFVYEITQDPGFSRGMQIYQVSSGKLQFRSGFGTPVVGKRLALDPQGRFLYFAAVSQLGGPPGIELYSMARNSDGSIGSGLVHLKSMCQSTTGETLNAMTALSLASHKTIYATCAGTANLVEYFVLDNSGFLTTSGDVPSSGQPEGMAIDPQGKFLFVANTGGNTVDVYAIDSATGALSSAPVQRQAAGTGPTSITFDSTGKFMYVANGVTNNISAFSFDGSTLQSLGVFTAGQEPISIAVVKP